MAGKRVAALALCALWVGLAHQSHAGLSTAERAPLRASGRVSDALLDHMPGRGERVPVLISFREPDAPAGPPGATAQLAATAGRGDAIAATLSRDEWRVAKRYRSLPILAGELSYAGLLRLSNHPWVRWIEPQLGGHGALAESLPLTKIDRVQNLGYTGQGVRVAILDTGVDTAHGDLGGLVVEERCWCSGNGGCCPGGGSTESGAGAAADDHGHGTHIAGIIASKGVVSPPGAAPNVDVVALKVLDSNNKFSVDQDVISALDWLNAESITQGSRYVDVVNMSLSTNLLYGRPCNPGGEVTVSVAWTNAVTQLTNRGILVVVAAGNRGTGIAAPAPACVEESFSVAASYDADFGGMVWDWGTGSCFDATTGADVWPCGTNAFDNGITGAKTDLVAPGASITSSWPGGLTAPLSGTSQAAAHVTGCAALVLEANAGNPTRTLADLEADLQTSPTSIVSTGIAAFGSSFPRLDCATAVPEASAPFYSLALLFGLAAAARRAAPSRQPSR